MKSKKWIVIGCISLALVIAEVVLLFVLVLPNIKRNQAMKYLEDGNATEAAKAFSEMSDEKVNGLKELVQDLIVYKANKCLAGEEEYADFYHTMEAVESVPQYKRMTIDAFHAVNIPQLKKTYQAAVDAEKKNPGGAETIEQNNEFRRLVHLQLKDEETIISNSWSEDDKTKYVILIQEKMDEVLKEKYDSYVAGNLDYDEMTVYARVANQFWYTNYSTEIVNNLEVEKSVKEAMDEAKARFDRQEYFETLDQIDNVREEYGGQEIFQKNWNSSFDTLYSEAESKAKTYYVEQAVEAAKNGDTAKAEDLKKKLQDRFGADFDISSIDDSLHTDWQKAYVEYMKDWKNNLKRDIPEEPYNDFIFGVSSMDTNLPEYVLLRDIDGDGTPELILAKSALLYILTYDGSKVVFVGMTPFLGLGDNGNIVLQQKGESGDKNVEILILQKMENNKLEVQKIAVYAEDPEGVVTYLTGSANDSSDLKEVEESEYEAAKEEILEQKKVESLEGARNIDGYEDYIFSYEQ